MSACLPVERAIIDLLLQDAVQRNRGEVKLEGEGGESAMDPLAVETAVVDEMAVLFGQFLDTVCSKLHRLAEIQRRQKPTKEDVRLLTHMGYFDLKDIQTALKHNSQVAKLRSKEISSIAKMCLPLEQEMERGLPAAEDSFLQPLWPSVKSRTENKAYIPSYMPNLPPEHTWKATPQFTERVQDPKVIRELLVLEGRLGEKALEHISQHTNKALLEDAASEPIMSPIFEEVLSDDDDDDGLHNANEPGNLVSNNFGMDEDDEYSTDEERMNGELARKPRKQERKFDLSQYAANRLASLEKRRLWEERRLQKRLNGQEARLGQIFGSYTQLPAHTDDLKDKLTLFKRQQRAMLIESLKVQHEQTKQKLAQQQAQREERLAKERELQSANEITVGMHQDQQHTGGEDIDMDFDMDFSDVEVDVDGEVDAALEEALSGV